MNPVTSAVVRFIITPSRLTDPDSISLPIYDISDPLPFPVQFGLLEMILGAIRGDKLLAEMGVELADKAVVADKALDVFRSSVGDHRDTIYPSTSV